MYIPQWTERHGWSDQVVLFVSPVRGFRKKMNKELSWKSNICVFRGSANG